MDESTTNVLIAVLVLLVIIVGWQLYSKNLLLIQMQIKNKQLNDLNIEIKDKLSSKLTSSEQEELQKKLLDQIESTTGTRVELKTYADQQLNDAVSKNQLIHTMQSLNTSTEKLIEACVLYYGLSLPADRLSVIKKYANALQVVFKKSDVFFNNFMNNLDSNYTDEQLNDIFKNNICRKANERNDESIIKQLADMQEINRINERLPKQLMFSSDEISIMLEVVKHAVPAIFDEFRRLCQSTDLQRQALKTSLQRLRSIYTNSKNYIVLMGLSMDPSKGEELVNPIMLESIFELYRRANLYNTRNCNMVTRVDGQQIQECSYSSGYKSPFDF